MATSAPKRSNAVTTGASSGIGLELARRCAKDGFDLLIAADEPEIQNAVGLIRNAGGDAGAVLKNKLQVAIAHITPAEQLAKQHAKEAAPGTAEH